MNKGKLLGTVKLHDGLTQYYKIEVYDFTSDRIRIYIYYNYSLDKSIEQLIHVLEIKKSSFADLTATAVSLVLEFSKEVKDE